MTHLTTAIDPEDAGYLDKLRDRVRIELGRRPTKSGIIRQMIMFILYEHPEAFIAYLHDQDKKYGEYA